MPRPCWMICLALASAVAVGCADGGGQELPTEAGTRLEVTAAEFDDGGQLPAALTCDGAGRPPRLSWSGSPQDTVEHAVVVTDPDAPGGTFVHLAVAAIPPDATTLEGQPPAGAVTGRNGGGETGWFPACPPEGDDPHRYVFAVYALDDATALEPGFDPSELLDVAARSASGFGRIQATYAR